MKLDFWKVHVMVMAYSIIEDGGAFNEGKKETLIWKVDPLIIYLPNGRRM